MKKQIIAIILTCACIATCLAPASASRSADRFDDVKPNDWFYDAVLFVLNKGLMIGMSDTSFAPDEPVTRAMIVTALNRLAGESSAAGANPFRDVKEGNWYYNAVMWAEANGIVNGFEDSTFRPDLNITREQFMTILYRYASYRNYDLSSDEGTGITRYSDYSEISSWALPAMRWAYGEKLILGRSDTLLCPLDSLTRAEMAMILMRFLEKDRSQATTSTNEPKGHDSDNRSRFAVTLSVDKTAVTEGETVTYTATIGRAPKYDLTVTLNNGQTITIEAGKTSGIVTVDTREDDGYRQGDQTLTVKISGVTRNSAEYGLENVAFDGTAVSTVVSDAVDDSSASKVVLSVDKTAVTEGNTIIYTATIGRAPKYDLTVTLNNGQTITIEAGKTSGIVTVETREDDGYKQGDQTLTVKISGVTQDSAEDGLERVTFDDKDVSTAVADDSDVSTAKVKVCQSNEAVDGTMICTAVVDHPPQTDLKLTLSNDVAITIRAGETTGTSASFAYNAFDAITLTEYTGGDYEKLVVEITVVNPPLLAEPEIAVDEALLQGGNTGNADGHATSGTGSFSVNLNGDATGTVQIGGENGYTIILHNGANPEITGSPATVNGVVFTVTGVSQTDDDYFISYSYELTGAQTHSDPKKVGADDTLKGSLDILVTDEFGDSAKSTLSVLVHDDGPSVTAVGDAAVSLCVDEADFIDGKVEHFSATSDLVVIDSESYFAILPGTDREGGRSYPLSLIDGGRVKGVIYERDSEGHVVTDENGNPSPRSTMDGVALKVLYNREIYDVTLVQNEDGSIGGFIDSKIRVESEKKRSESVYVIDENVRSFVMFNDTEYEVTDGNVEIDGETYEVQSENGSQFIIIPNSVEVFRVSTNSDGGIKLTQYRYMELKGGASIYHVVETTDDEGNVTEVKVDEVSLENMIAVSVFERDNDDDTAADSVPVNLTFRDEGIGVLNEQLKMKGGEVEIGQATAIWPSFKSYVDRDVGADNLKSTEVSLVLLDKEGHITEQLPVLTRCLLHTVDPSSGYQTGEAREYGMVLVQDSPSVIKAYALDGEGGTPGTMVLTAWLNNSTSSAKFEAKFNSDASLVHRDGDDLLSEIAVTRALAEGDNGADSIAVKVRVDDYDGTITDYYAPLNITVDDDTPMIWSNAEVSLSPAIGVGNARSVTLDSIFFNNQTTDMRHLALIDDYGVNIRVGQDGLSSRTYTLGFADGVSYEEMENGERVYDTGIQAFYQGEISSMKLVIAADGQSARAVCGGSMENTLLDIGIITEGANKGRIVAQPYRDASFLIGETGATINLDNRLQVTLVVFDGDGDAAKPGQGSSSTDDPASCMLQFNLGRAVSLDSFLVGTDEENTLTGDSSHSYVVGLGGNDAINGSAGADHLFGCGGDDTINGCGGDDFLYGGADNDILDGGADNDWLYGQDGKDTMTGGAGNDRLDGGPGADKESGEAGNDIIYYDAEDETVDGGTGIDLLLTSGAEDLSTLLDNSQVSNIEALVRGDVDGLLIAEDFQLDVNYGIVLEGTGTSSNPYSMELIRAAGSGESKTSGWAEAGRSVYEHYNDCGEVDLVMEVKNLTPDTSSGVTIVFTA